MTELTADFTRAMPGGKLDDSTYEAIESALDGVGAPLTDKPLSAGGRFLTLVERVFALEAERVAALRAATASPESLSVPQEDPKSSPSLVEDKSVSRASPSAALYGATSDTEPSAREKWGRKARWNGFGSPRIYLADFNREDEAETEITVAYTYSPGSDDTYDASRGGPGGWDPGYPAEVEIYAAFGPADEVTLTEAEELRFGQWLMENPPEDDAPDYRDDDR